MSMTPIEGSSAITHYEYTPATKTLKLQFARANEPSVITDVDPATFREFLEAKSKGKFFHERLK